MEIFCKQLSSNSNNKKAHASHGKPNPQIKRTFKGSYKKKILKTIEVSSYIKSTLFIVAKNDRVLYYSLI
jgi:hypothetical protein